MNGGSYILRRRKLGKTSCNAIERFSKTGIRTFRNDIAQLPDTDEPRCVFRWGCVSEVPRPAGTDIVNKAEAIHLVSDKISFRQLLDQHELCPTTWTEGNDVQFPAVVRPGVHHQGRHFYVVSNTQELREAISRCVAKAGSWYASPLIDKQSEYRVGIVQQRAVWVARKFPGNPDQVAWNVYQGGRFENVHWNDWPFKVVKDAIAAFKLSSLDFGGVDIMVDGDGETYVLELNSAPSLTSPYRQECFAKAFDWIVNNGKDPIGLSDRKGGYKKFIHPAICSEAWT